MIVCIIVCKQAISMVVHNYDSLLSREVREEVRT